MNDTRWKPSVTVAAIVEQDGRFLLVEERTPDGLRLNNPAGHLDPGESPLQGAVRECLEETARHFTATALLGLYMSRMHGPARPGHAAEDVTYLRLAYTGTVSEPEPGRALDAPVVRTLWLSPDEIRASVARHRSPLLLKCMQDHLAGRRLPLDALQVDGSVWGR